MRAAEGGVDVVFTDIETPGLLDGLTLACLVGRSWPNVPVLVTSGRLRPDGDALADCAGFVPKPYDLHHIAALIDRLAGA